MAHPLRIRIAALRRRAWSVLVLHAASCAVAVLVAVCAILALGDFAWRYEETGVRLLSTLAALAAIGWAVYRFVLPLTRTTLDDVFLARQIERSHPVLHERLSGAVAFLNAADDDAFAGSSTLRRTVIHETTTDFMPLPTTQVVTWRPVVVPLVIAAVVFAAAGGLYFANRQVANIALLRLALPLGSTAWPQTNHLKLVNPIERVAVGSRFRAEVVDADGNDIPGGVTLLIRNSADAAPEPRSMHLQGGSYVAERERIVSDFAYRAVGGDDRSMPWVDVRVVDPPAVQQIRWRYVFPDYVRWTPFDSEMRPSDALAQAAPVPSGTTIEFFARTNKPLLKATLVVGAVGNKFDASLDADRSGFSFTVDGANPWRTTRSETFRFELIGDDGFQSANDLKYDLTVEADPPPWAKLDRPRGPPEDPRGDVFVTPDAVVDVGVTAGDAFTVRPEVALKTVALRYSRSDRSSEPDQTLPLYAGPATLEPAEFAAPTRFRDEEVRALAHPWELKPLGLQPGTFVNLYATATDYAEQTRQSESRRLRVVAPAEFLERFNERQRALHAELKKLHDRQNDAAGQTEEIGKQLAAEPKPDERPGEAISQTLELQRQVSAGLGLDRANRRNSETTPPESARDGVSGRVQRMLDDLKQNRIDNHEVASQLGEIQKQLRKLEESKSAEQAATELSDSLRQELSTTDRRQKAAEALGRAKQKQDDVLGSLDAMLNNLAQWEDYGKFHEELSRIAKDQERVAAETQEHLQQRLAKKNDPAADARKRDDLANRQSGLARRFESLKRQMTQAQSAENQETLQQALTAAERENPAGAMRAAGEELRNDRVGQAPQRQQEALEKLKQVMQALSAQNADQLARLVAKLREGEQELAKLREEQKGLKSKFHDAEKIKDEAQRRQELERLARQQRELQKKTEKLAEQLKRLQAERSAGKTAKGGSKMSGAGEQAQQGDAGSAAEQAEAAEKDLEEASRELARERREAEADLARELAAKLEDDLKASIARQERVVAETQRYDAQAQTKPLTRAELIGLLDLAREQETLEAEARAASDRFGSAPTFKAALDGAADEMHRAAQQLRERDTGAATQRAEQTAVRRFQQLLSALKPRAKKGEQQQDGQQGGGEGGAGGGGGQQDGASLAELVLIKLMQEEIAERTKELDATRQRGKLTTAEQEELHRLGREQGKLADLLLDLIGTSGEKDDEPLPDIKLDEKPGERKSPEPKKREPDAGGN